MNPSEDALPLDLSLAALRARYRDGTLTPTQLVDALHRRIDDEQQALDRHAWIHRLDRDALRAYAQALEGRDPEALPLYGIPFAIKDNIDLAGVPTTAACPAYAYTPERSATAVQRLIDAGAIPLGKTNLDQFATGLVGTRSPYGACGNALDARYVSGGSSSGSAVVVARGLASFSLGTDTAGSGRVPAMFNNLVGLKPSLGRVPATGVVPACRTLDTVSVFALSADDAAAVLAVIEGEDGIDPYARAMPAPKATLDGAFRFGVPRDEDLQFHGDPQGAAWFAQAVRQLVALGGTPVAIDLRPLREVAELLYQGPWIAERYAAIADFIRASPEQLHPVTRALIEPAMQRTAVETFQALYRLQSHKLQAAAMWSGIATLVVPTAPRHYTLAQVEASPIERNAHLGHYTNFVNLLDLAAVAVPTGWSPTEEGASMPVGITLIAPAGQDAPLLSLAGRLHAAAVDRVGALPHAPHRATPTPASPAAAPTDVAVAVCGAHLSGLPLNHQLTERGGRLLCATRTAPCYRFYALPGGPPHRPGLVRCAANDGAAIEVEVWLLPVEAYGSFVAGIPAPLGIGWVQLEDGSQVQGFVCEAIAAEGARDISGTGSWRRHLAGAG